MHQRRFARAGNAGDHHHHAQRDLDVDVLQVVRARAEKAHHAALGSTGRRARGAETLQLAAQVAGGERAVAVGHQRGQRAFEDDVAAVFAGAGAEVHDVVGGAHHVGIVLHHHDGVAEVAQLLQDADEPPGIAAVQPDGRLVEHVAGAHQPRAQAGGQLDALRFAARERGRKAVEREVFEPHIVEELQALADLHQDLVGDGGLFRGEFQASKNSQRLGDVHAHDIGQVLAAHAHVERLLAQARALAFRAERVAAVAAEEHAHVQLVLLGFQVIEEAADEFVDALRVRLR